MKKTSRILSIFILIGALNSAACASNPSCGEAAALYLSSQAEKNKDTSRKFEENTSTHQPYLHPGALSF